MTNPDRPPSLPKQISTDGCVTTLFVLFGVLLLLPGLCSLIFMAVILPGGSAGGLWTLWAIGFLIAAFGIGVIGYAVRHR